MRISKRLSVSLCWFSRFINKNHLFLIWLPLNQPDNRFVCDVLKITWFDSPKMFVIFSRRLYCKIHNWSRPKLDVLRHFWWSNQGFYSPAIHTGHCIAFDALISQRKQHQNEQVQCTQITQKQHVQKRELLFNRHGKYCIRQCNTLPAHFRVKSFFSFFCLITLCQSSRVFVCKLKKISKQNKKCVQFWQASTVCVCARVCIRTHMCQNIPQTLNDMFSNSADATRVLYVYKNRMSYGTQLAGVFFSLYNGR